jgi:large subunit ribosomal protein L18
VRGSTARPRLAIYRSTNHIYAQIIDDERGQTMVSASTAEKDLRGSTGGNIEAAKRIGRAIAERARAAGINQVVFDRGGYLYHGRIKALTDAAREAGLNPDEKPRVSEATPAGAEAKPAKGEGKPAKGEAKAAKGEAKAAKGEAKPAKGGAKPPKGEAKPAKGGAKRDKSEIESGANETIRARSEATPAESDEAASVQAKEASTEQE